jgi:asparagine N-glycosylation enzyme membrane subunit Stt3
MKSCGLKSKFQSGWIILLLVYLPWSSCRAEEQSASEASYLGALLALLILLILGSGIFFALKIHSLLKGGELSSVWVFSGLALAILLISVFLEFLQSLGAINGLTTFVFLLQLLGFFLLVFGLILLKKKLS